MKRGLSIIALALSLFVFSGVAHGATLRESFEQGIGSRWDDSLSRYEKVLEVEIEALKVKEQAVAPSSENLRIALTNGTDEISNSGVPVRQTGTVGDTAMRLWKEFVLLVVGVIRWLLRSIVAFYLTLVLIVFLLFKSMVGIVAILTPKKRIF